MCEIAVFDPERTGINLIQQVAYKFNEEQGDGLGLLGIKNTGDSFEYETYCSINPHWATVYGFLRRHTDDVWRWVVHGRAATAGDANRQNAHPIPVDCPKCDFDYVVHNGSVRKHRQKRGGLKTNDHEFETRVDSEVLAHTVSELPESVEGYNRNTYNIKGNLNYLLFGEDGILVRVARKYKLSDDFVMTCSRREFDDPGDMGFPKSASNEWMLIEPGAEGPDIEIEERTRWNSGNSRTSTASSDQPYRGRNSSSDEQGELWPDSEAQENSDQYAVIYTDLLPGYSGLTAMQVAPGVIRVVGPDGKEGFVFEEENPDTYAWYMNAENRYEADDPPEETDDEQQTLDEAEQAAVEEGVRSAMNNMEAEPTMAEMAEVEEAVRETVAADRESIEGSIEG